MKDTPYWGWWPVVGVTNGDCEEVPAEQEAVVAVDVVVD